jgi:hypothetical protein
MRWMLLIIILLIAACAPAPSTPANPLAGMTMVATVNLETVDGTVDQAKITVQTCIASAPLTVDEENPVVLLERKNGCTDIFRFKFHMAVHTVIAYSLNFPDKLLGPNLGVGNPETSALDIPGRADASPGLLGGEFMLSHIGEDNAVIVVVIPLDAARAENWPTEIIQAFAERIESKNEDICGWLKTRIQSLVDLTGKPGIDIAGYLAKKHNCSVPQSTLQPTPTSQWR